MVDKKDKASSRGSSVDQQSAVADRVVTSLERRISKFDEKISILHQEMLELKRQQEELIEILKEKLKK
jgi:TolA-binding protein